MPVVSPRTVRTFSLGALGALALASLGALCAVGCSSAPPPKDARATPVSSSAPEPFQEMRTLVMRLGRARDASDAAGARALVPDVVTKSRQMLKMGIPDDLKRELLARYLDGRAAYAQAVNGLARAAVGDDDAALWSSSRELDAAYWAWLDAYRGKPSEGAV